MAKVYRVVDRAVYNKEAKQVYDKNHKFDGADVLPSRLDGWLNVGLVIQFSGPTDEVKAPAKTKSTGKPKTEDQDADNSGEKPLSKLTKAELKKIAKDLEIKRFSGMKVEELIEAIEGARSAATKSSYELLSELNRDDLESAAGEYNVDFSGLSDEDLVNAIWAAAGYEPVEEQDEN